MIDVETCILPNSEQSYLPLTWDTCGLTGAHHNFNVHSTGLEEWPYLIVFNQNEASKSLVLLIKNSRSFWILKDQLDWSWREVKTCFFRKRIYYPLDWNFQIFSIVRTFKMKMSNWPLRKQPCMNESHIYKLYTDYAMYRGFHLHISIESLWGLKVAGLLEDTTVPRHRGRMAVIPVFFFWELSLFYYFIISMLFVNFLCFCS